MTIKEIVGQLFFRNTHKSPGGRRAIIVAGIIEVDDAVPIKDEHYHLVTGFIHDGRAVIVIHTQGTEPMEKDYEGSRIDQIVCDHRWKLPQVKQGDYIGKPTPTEIEKDYF